MLHIRKRVFETNSSSSHSLTVGGSDLAELPFPEEVLRRGMIDIPVDNFQWEWKRFYTAAGKASYLLTQLAGNEFSDYGNIPNESESEEDLTLRLCQENEKLGLLRKVIEEYTGCAVTFRREPSGWAGIDHESEGVGLDLFNDENLLQRFLFDPTSYIQTGNDNDYAPTMIDTDDNGKEPYSKNRAAELRDNNSATILKARRKSSP